MAPDADNVLDPTQLLHEWFEFWADDPNLPVKLPNALHIRTAMYLTIQGVTIPIQEPPGGN